MSFDLFNHKDLFDSHCHLSDAQFDADRAEVVKRAVERGVSKIIDIGTSLATSRQVLETAAKFPEVAAAVGIDPEILITGSDLFDPTVLCTDGNEAIDGLVAELAGLIESHKDQVAMLGEIGMDKYWLDKKLKAQEISGVDMGQSLDCQRYLLTKQLEVAEQFKLPVSVHSRAAEETVWDICAPFAARGLRGIFHSYTGPYDVARKILDAGWGLGVNGIITFSSSQELRELYRKILGDVTPTTPADLYSRGVFLETDSPYLSPDGKRGLRNEPGNIADIWEHLLKGL